MTVEQIELRKSLINEVNSIIAGSEMQNRKLNADEEQRIAELDKQIKQLTEEEIPKPINLKNSRKMENFSLLKSIRNVVEGKAHDEITLQVLQEGTKQMREAGVAYKGQLTLPLEHRAALDATSPSIETAVFDILTPLLNALVFNKVGATFLTNLKGNLVIPKYSGSNVAWKSELDAATDGTGTMGSVEYTPKRVTGIFDISKMLLAQDSKGVEVMLQRDIVNAIAVALEKAVFAKDVDANAPAGLFTGTLDVSGALSWANVVSMESKLDAANAMLGNLAYITHPALRGLAKTTPKVANTAVFVQENETINGYPVYATNSMASGIDAVELYYGMVFGNWADMVIAQWGGIDITVDPYTQAGNGKIRLYVNAYFDAKPRRDESFVIAGLK